MALPHALLPHQTQDGEILQEQAGNVALLEVSTNSRGKKYDLAGGESTVSELDRLDQYADRLSAEFDDYTNRSSNRSQMRNIYRQHRAKMSLMQFGAVAEGVVRATRSKPGVQRQMAYFFVTLRKRLEARTSLPQPAPTARRQTRPTLPATAALSAIVRPAPDSTEPAATVDLPAAPVVPDFDPPTPAQLATWYAVAERLAEQLFERERRILQQARLVLMVEGIAVIALPQSTMAERFVSRHAETVAQMFNEICGHDVEVKFVDRW